MQTNIIQDVDGLIAALGGASALGERLGIRQSAVSMWKVRGEVPAGWHLRLYLICQSQGLAVDPMLWGFDRPWTPRSFHPSAA